MKRISRAFAVFGACLLSSLVIGGCQPVRVPAIVTLSPSIGSLDLQAGTPSTHSGLITFNNTSGISVGSGTLGLDPSAITFTRAAPGKFIAFQAPATTLTVTVRLAPAADRETVCETGEAYGPFSVTLDESLNPVNIDPSTFSLTQDTVDLLNAGSFSVCIEAMSPVDGTVVIESLSFDLGL